MTPETRFLLRAWLQDDADFGALLDEVPSFILAEFIDLLGDDPDEPMTDSERRWKAMQALLADAEPPLEDEADEQPPAADYN